MEKHVALYIRVSSKRQDMRSQKPDLEKWIEAMSNGVPIRWYRDTTSGKTMDREGWRKLEQAIDDGKVAKLVVWRLDRLGRTASGLTALFEKLQSLKVGLVSLKDGLDLSTPAGRLIANVLASVAAYENEVRSERIVAGQQAAIVNGKRWGGSKPGGRVSVTEEQERTVKKLHEEGESISDIAKSVSLSRPTIPCLPQIDIHPVSLSCKFL